VAKIGICREEFVKLPDVKFVGIVEFQGTEFAKTNRSSVFVAIL
jgi:hypothetical protein